jgi:hypothetical protein
MYMALSALEDRLQQDILNKDMPSVGLGSQHFSSIKTLVFGNC